MSLPALLLEPLVRGALLEDLGRAGDITTDALVPAGLRAEASFVARQPGVLAGLDLARLAFALVDPEVVFSAVADDGDRMAPGDVVARLAGPARGILTGERVALNFMGHLSGVATATASIVQSIAGFGTRVVCTRKTTPGLRAVEKICGAVRRRFQSPLWVG